MQARLGDLLSVTEVDGIGGVGRDRDGDRGTGARQKLSMRRRAAKSRLNVNKNRKVSGATYYERQEHNKRRRVSGKRIIEGMKGLFSDVQCKREKDRKCPAIPPRPHGLPLSLLQLEVLPSTVYLKQLDTKTLRAHSAAFI